MKPKLPYWLISLFFLPFAVCQALLDTVPRNPHDPQFKMLFALANLSAVATLLMIVSCQFYFANKFNNQLNEPSMLFRLHLWLPMAFLSSYTLFVAYNSIDYFIDAQSATGINYSPIKNSDLRSSGGLAIVILLIYSAISFLFVNNKFVSAKITQFESTQQDSLRFDYLLPMKRIVRSSVFIFGALILIGAIIDLLKIY